MTLLTRKQHQRRSVQLTACCLPVLLPAVVNVAHATVFLSIEQAQAEIFPGVALRPRIIVLRTDQVEKISTQCNSPVTNRIVRLWQGPAGETFIIDTVLGKHELITYALGIKPPGIIQHLEILEYKEHYGMEIRNAAWRQQFSGKTLQEAPHLGQQIAIISGATLSSRHLTEGIQRVLCTYALLFP